MLKNSSGEALLWSGFVGPICSVNGCENSDLVVAVVGTAGCPGMSKELTAEGGVTVRWEEVEALCDGLATGMVTTGVVTSFVCCGWVCGAAAGSEISD